MNKSLVFCYNSLKNAHKLILVNRRLDNSSQIRIDSEQFYKQTKNILRNRYQHREKDGKYKVFNETITILPKEYEAQGTFIYFNTD